MAFLLGKNAKAYYSTTALTAIPSDDTELDAADEVGNIMDLSLDVESTFVDITTRADAAQGFLVQTAVLKNSTITFDIQWQTGDQFTVDLLAAWQNNTVIAFFALDQAATVTGAQGLVGNFTVSMTKEEPLNDIQKASVTLTLASYPSWHTTSA